MVTIAHLSDIHIPFRSPLKLRHLKLKQKLGYANWRLNRQTIHTNDAIKTLIADLKRQSIDHMMVSGDLTNIGLTSEYETALAFLTQLGTPKNISVLAGNHDLCVSSCAPYAQTYWGDYMLGNEEGRAIYTPSNALTPYVTRLQDVALIGVNSAIATRPFCAQGFVGCEQRTRLRDVLRRTEEMGLYRVVALHHPPVRGLTKSSRALRDETVFEDLLRDEGADLIIYGHNHIYQETTLDTVGGLCKIIGVPSLSVGTNSHYDMGAYHLLHIDPSAAQGSKLRVERRSLTPAGDGIVTLPYPAPTRTSLAVI